MLSQKDSPTYVRYFRNDLEVGYISTEESLLYFIRKKSILNFFNNFALHPVFVWKVFGTQELYLLFVISK